MFHEKLFHLESSLNNIYDRPDPKTVNNNHVFQSKLESEHICYCQDFHDGADFRQNLLIRTMPTAMGHYLCGP